MDKKSHHHHHSHSHHHHHSHGGTVGRMKFALFLNLSFAVIELIGGLWTNSIAILSDALHDFGDAMAMALAIGLEKFSGKKSDGSYSYGYRRFSTLGAVITGIILVAGSLFILIEAIPRMVNPQQPHADGMILLALLGVAVNGYAAYRVSHGGGLNERMLMWHMIEDVVGWVLVLVGALVMKFFHLPQLDAGLAIILSLWILYNVAKNLRETFRVFLMGAPVAVSAEDVATEIKKFKEVEDVHHMHLWSLDGESHIFTAHIVICAGVQVPQVDRLKADIKKKLKEFNIVEATIETEMSGSQCADPSHE